MTVDSYLGRSQDEFAEYSRELQEKRTKFSKNSSNVIRKKMKVVTVFGYSSRCGLEFC